MNCESADIDSTGPISVHPCSSVVPCLSAIKHGKPNSGEVSVPPGRRMRLTATQTAPRHQDPTQLACVVNEIDGYTVVRRPSRFSRPAARRRRRRAAGRSGVFVGRFPSRQSSSPRRQAAWGRASNSDRHGQAGRGPGGGAPRGFLASDTPTPRLLLLRHTDTSPVASIKHGKPNSGEVSVPPGTGGFWVNVAARYLPVVRLSAGHRRRSGWSLR